MDQKHRVNKSGDVVVVVLGCRVARRRCVRVWLVCVQGWPRAQGGRARSLRQCARRLTATAVHRDLGRRARPTPAGPRYPTRSYLLVGRLPRLSTRYSVAVWSVHQRAPVGWVGATRATGNVPAALGRVVAVEHINHFARSGGLDSAAVGVADIGAPPRRDSGSHVHQHCQHCDAYAHLGEQT